MVGRRKRIPLDVYLNGKRIGQMHRAANGAIGFRYDAEWLVWEHALPVSLSLPLREDPFFGDPVVAVFENLLPDSYDIRHRIAERVQAGGNDAYHLLSAIGRDCIGALQFMPEGEEPGPAGLIDGRAIEDGEIAEKFANLGRAPLGLDGNREFRISLAGAQEKMALLFWKGRWHVPHGATPTTHIFKPQIGHLPNGVDLSRSVENEYLCMRLTAACGLPTADVEIGDFEGRRALVIQRFDRRWTRDGRLLRLPQEDFCQALSIPPTHKYESEGGPAMRQILGLLSASDHPDDDRRMFVKSLIVYWLLGATDGHAKNFSLYLFSGSRFRLTPLYDVISTQPLVDANILSRGDFRMAMAMGDNRHYRVDEIVPRHFRQSVVSAGLSAILVDEVLTDLAQRVPKALEQVMAELPVDFPHALTRSIAEGVESRLRLVANAA